MKKSDEKNVYDVTNDILKYLEHINGTSSYRQLLAELRNSINKDISQAISIWSIVFEYLPESFLGTTDTLSNQEKAIINALQLYALHQQGKSYNVNAANPNDKSEFRNFGDSLRRIRNIDDRNALDNRFNTLITSSNYNEFIYHLKSLVNILRSNSNASVKVNYAQLAQDLYYFQGRYPEGIRITWSRNYYKVSRKKSIDEQAKTKS